MTLRHFFIGLSPFLLLFFASPVSAWEAHDLLTYMALKNMPEISQIHTIPAETLDSFVAKEKQGLAKVLKDNEQWARQHVPEYPPLPSNLVFMDNTSDTATLKKRFLESLRINPELTYPLFLLLPSNGVHRLHNTLPASMIMLPGLTTDPAIKIINLPIEKINPGEKVSALEIISSAAEEPDYGLDVGVWQNNKTWFGNIYGFGNQSFGNPNLYFSSQAPFHMGFYYESPILYAAAGFLKRAYPEYRIHQYLALSRFAFSTGHPYWGFRFLGWALHYIQDLSQPYHSTTTPGASTTKLVTFSILDMLDITKPKKDLIQRLTNRHFALENYTREALNKALQNNSPTNPINQAFADQQHDVTYPAYNDSYPRNVVAKESHAKADKIDELIKNAFPKRYTTDPNYIFYTTEPNINLLDIAEKNPNPSVEKLNIELNNILRSIGSHTRNTVRYIVDNK